MQHIRYDYAVRDTSPSSGAVAASFNFCLVGNDAERLERRKNALGAMGHIAVVHTNIAQALRAAAARRFDALLIDLGVETGMAVVNAMRRSAERNLRETPAILFAAPQGAVAAKLSAFVGQNHVVDSDIRDEALQARLVQLISASPQTVSKDHRALRKLTHRICVLASESAADRLICDAFRQVEAVQVELHHEPLTAFNALFQTRVDCMVVIDLQPGGRSRGIPLVQAVRDVDSSLLIHPRIVAIVPRVEAENDYHLCGADHVVSLPFPRPVPELVRAWLAEAPGVATSTPRSGHGKAPRPVTPGTKERRSRKRGATGNGQDGPQPAVVPPPSVGGSPVDEEDLLPLLLDAPVSLPGSPPVPPAVEAGPRDAQGRSSGPRGKGGTAEARNSAGTGTSPPIFTPQDLLSPQAPVLNPVADSGVMGRSPLSDGGSHEPAAGGDSDDPSRATHDPLLEAFKKLKKAADRFYGDSGSLAS